MQFDVLSRNLNVFAPHFLEASAGTGKTFAIEHLVTRLLVERDPSFTIEQILVVTFTRAAARELKLRIRRSLMRAKQELALSYSSIDYLQAILEKGEAAVKLAVEKIEAALICYDAAQIYTLHGFCHRILQEFAFEASVGLEVNDPDKKEHVAIFERIVKSYLKESVKAPEYSPLQVRILLNQYQREPRKMISSLVDLVQGNRKIGLSLNHRDLLAAFLKELKALPDIKAVHLKADLSLILPQYKKMTGREVSFQVDILAEILEAKNCTIEQFDRLLKGEFFLEKLEPHHLKVRSKLPDRSSLHYPGLFESLRRSILPLIRIAKDPSQIFLRLGSDIQKVSQPVLERNEKFSPDALLLKVEKALQLPRFVERVREKYRAAIIDEFQDTDPIQWNIFQKLFLSHLDALCLVGDPKQSIYAFRNADVYTYLEAANAMGASAKKHLDVNYRSTSALVDALNLLFSKASGRWMPLPKAKKPLEVNPVKSGAKLFADEGQVPIQFFIGLGKKGRSKKFPTDEIFEKKVFPFIADEILALHREKGVEYHDIAILIKDRFQAQAVIDYLKSLNIPANNKRGVCITESVAYHALKEVLAAVCSPHDLNKLKVALGGPIIAWGEESLRNGVKDLNLLKAKAQMQSLHQLLFQKGFGVFFQSFLNSSWGDGTSVLLSLCSRQASVDYQDLRKVAELLIEEETIRGAKADELLLFLEEIAVESKREETRFKVASQEEKGSVAVMTMHMSKGLEFDTVFALGLASRQKLSERIVVDQGSGSQLTVYDATDPACQRAIEEQDAEKMRQLYVALTRAKKRLYIPLMIEEEQKPIEYGEAAPIELFFAHVLGSASSHIELYQTLQTIDLNRSLSFLDSLSPLICYRVLEECVSIKHEETADTPLCPLVRPAALHLPQHNEQLFSFSSLAKKEAPLEIVKPEENTLPSPHTLPMGSETGHILHLIMEKIFKRGLHHPLDEEGLSILIDHEVSYSALEPYKPILLEWILGLLKKPLLGFSLCDIPHHQIQQEMEFCFPVSKGLMKGFADLVFEFNHRYYLLDWKSNYLGSSDAEYTPQKLVQAMQTNDYYLQAAIYAAALERYVKLFDNRPFSECFGGAFYYFIRGQAVLHFIPEPFKDLPL